LFYLKNRNKSYIGDEDIFKKKEEEIKEIEVFQVLSLVMGDSIKPFNPEGEDVGQRWTIWLERFELYLKVKKVAEDDRMVHLLFYAGEFVHEKYRSLKKVGDDYDAVVVTLNAVFNPPVNKQMNVFKFQNLKQFDGEPFDDFVSRLRSCVTTCGFGAADLDGQLKSQIIQGCLSDKLRRSALEKESNKLEELISMGKVAESVDLYMKSANSRSDIAIGSSIYCEKVNRVDFNRTVGENKQKPKSCFNCGGLYPHQRDTPCPAIGKKCNICKKENHFAA
jgi:hypothetical protein